jgi:hypothetical protein
VQDKRPLLKKKSILKQSSFLPIARMGTDAKVKKSVSIVGFEKNKIEERRSENSSSDEERLTDSDYDDREQ